MIHEPRCLLRYADGPVNLVGANAVLTTHHQPHCSKPLVQTERGILHDGSDFHAELRFSVPSLALPEPSGSNEGHVFGATGRADHTMLPFRSMCHEVVQAVPLIRKIANRFQEGLGFVQGFHTSSLLESRVLVKYIFAQFRSPLVRSDGGKYSAPPRHWSGTATKPDHVVEGLYRRTHECAGWRRFLHGGGAHLAGVGDLLCVVFPSPG